jgi:predicted HAD superfamily Cof-like phosphohydrolase
MIEEVKEWEESAICNDDVDKRAKELADILYTVFGTIITEGLQDYMEQAFDAVHQSNMSKMGENGKPVKRIDGKVLKGPNYQEPDLSFIVRAVSSIEPGTYRSGKRAWQQTMPKELNPDPINQKK